MIIRDFKFFPYSLKLKTPFKNSAFTIEERKGFIVRIIDDNDFVVYGEVAPLPGFSVETIEECESALNKINYSILDKAAKKTDFDLMLELQDVAYLPSIQFGFEQAIISLLIKRNELNSLLTQDKAININAVVALEAENVVLRQVDELLAKDFKTIKIKVGNNKFENNVKLINKITSRIDDSIKIRLDANGSWNYEQSEYAVMNLDKAKIELIEQPVSDINEIVMLSDFSPIPIAVDELIKNSNDAKNLIERSNITTFVLKPSILGGIVGTIGLIKSAEKWGKKIIISSAFESVVGRSALVLLASLVNGEHAHGLNTAPFFENDLNTDYYSVVKGRIYFDHKKYPPKFDGIKL